MRPPASGGRLSGSPRVSSWVSAVSLAEPPLWSSAHLSHRAAERATDPLLLPCCWLRRWGLQRRRVSSSSSSSSPSRQRSCPPEQSGRALSTGGVGSGGRGSPRLLPAQAALPWHPWGEEWACCRVWAARPEPWPLGCRSRGQSLSPWTRPLALQCPGSPVPAPAVPPRERCGSGDEGRTGSPRDRPLPGSVRAAGGRLPLFPSSCPVPLVGSRPSLTAWGGERGSSGSSELRVRACVCVRARVCMRVHVRVCVRVPATLNLTRR